MRLKLIALACTLFAASPASAQVCNFSNTGINFGSMELSSTSNSQATGTVTASCTGTAGRTITICPNIGSGTGGNDASASRRYMTFGTNRVEYNIYQNNGQGQIWGSYVWPWSPRPPAMSIALSGNGTGSTQRTIFGRVFGAAVPPGTYTSNFSGGHTLFDYGYAPSFTCGSATSPRAVQVPFSVSVTNTSACQITTTPMDFGAINAIAGNIDATNTISVTCSPGVKYTVGLSNGTAGTGPVARKLSAPSTSDTITYGIYTNANRTAPWGANAASGNGNGRADTFTAYGRIPAQATPAPAAYADTVVVTVTY